MALKNPNIFPQFCVYVWKEVQRPNGEWDSDCHCADKFDNEPEAYALYESIRIRDNVVEVDLEKDNGTYIIPLRHKDTAGEYIY